MKKVKMLSLVLAALLALSGCAGQDTGEQEGLEDVSGVAAQSQDQPRQETAEEPQEDVWGLTLSAEEITPTGLTVVFTQSGGEVSGQLETGSVFWLQQWQEEQWQPVEQLIEEENLAWTMEAYLIEEGQTTRLETRWSALYGELAPGSYRLGKQVMDFRGTGDYDTRDYYAYFDIPQEDD